LTRQVLSRCASGRSRASPRERSGDRGAPASDRGGSFGHATAWWCPAGKVVRQAVGAVKTSGETT